MNPNLTNNFQGYKPSEAYYNKTKDYIAIYITGKIDEFYFDAMGSVGSSYVAKIIYDRKKNNFARIIVPATYLFSYGWIRCENFWPF